MLLKMAALCARSEQCEADIARRLYAKGLPVGDVDWVVNNLKQQSFIDDRRFAAAFARDKVRFSAWGRRKIRAALIAKRIKESIIAGALEEINDDDYAEAIERAARAKALNLNLGLRDDQLKLYRHLLSRGFESELAIAEVKKECGR